MRVQEKKDNIINVIKLDFKIYIVIKHVTIWFRRDWGQNHSVLSSLSSQFREISPNFPTQGICFSFLTGQKFHAGRGKSIRLEATAPA